MSNSLSFLIIDTYYPRFLLSHYNNSPGFADKNYTEQKVFIMERCFYTADFYSRNLKKIGYKAGEIIHNNNILQMKLASEDGLKTEKTVIERLADKLPGIKKRDPALSIPLKVLEEQIKRKKPYILYSGQLILSAFISG